MSLTFRSLSRPVLIGGLVGLALAVSQGTLFWMMDRVLERTATLEKRLTDPVAATSTTPTTPEVITPTASVSRAYSLPEALRGGRVSPSLPIFKKDPKDGERLHVLQADASAIALTNDGWVVFPASMLPSKKLSDIRVGWRGKLYTPTQGLVDTSTGMIFARLPVQDLPITALTTKADTEIGQGVWIEERGGGYTASYLQRIDTEDGGAVVSSDTWNKRFVIAGVHEASTAVWDERGRLLGIATAEGVLPAEALRFALASILARGDIRRPSLGVSYIDTAYLYHAQDGSPVRGVIVQLDKKAASSSAAREWLRDGDVIERVERDVLDANWSLAERLAEYQPTATITLVGQRSGAPLEVRIPLIERVTSEALTP